LEEKALRRSIMFMAGGNPFAGQIAETRIKGQKQHEA
jgi:hypothetical protein